MVVSRRRRCRTHPNGIAPWTSAGPRARRYHTRERIREITARERLLLPVEEVVGDLDETQPAAIDRFPSGVVDRLGALGTTCNVPFAAGGPVGSRTARSANAGSFDGRTVIA